MQKVSPSHTPVESYFLGTKVWPIIGILRYLYLLSVATQLHFTVNFKEKYSSVRTKICANSQRKVNGKFGGQQTLACVVMDPKSFLRPLFSEPSFTDCQFTIVSQLRLKLAVHRLEYWFRSVIAYRLQLSQNLWDCPGFLAVLSWVPKAVLLCIVCPR